MRAVRRSRNIEEGARGTFQILKEKQFSVVLLVVLPGDGGRGLVLSRHRAGGSCSERVGAVLAGAGLGVALSGRSVAGSDRKNGGRMLAVPAQGAGIVRTWGAACCAP